jgi:23S rRNA A2030 N6-methylase RlmJ
MIILLSIEILTAPQKQLYEKECGMILVCPPVQLINIQMWANQNPLKKKLTNFSRLPGLLNHMTESKCKYVAK